MKRIIYFGNNNPFKHKRGIENVIQFQSKALENSLKYYIFFDDEKSIKIFRWENMICIGIPHNKFRFIILNKIMFYIKKKYRNECIIHSHNPLMTFFYSGKTDLMTVHDGLYYQNREIGHKLVKLFYIIEKLMYLKIKKVQFISDFSKKMSLFKGKNYIKIFNTTPFENIVSNEIVKWEKKIKLFTVRSIEERARVDLLIELAKKRKDLDIKIAGKGPLLETYRNIIKEKKLKNIQLLGFVSDEEVIAYYKTCDMVIVLAEHGEGFGLPIIEGYLFNKPVIASNKCAIPEVIINKSFLFENNVKSIEKSIENIRNYTLNYKEYYDENFSMEKILKKYKKVYLNIGEKDETNK